MNSKAVTEKCRRSKRQAGLDVSPEVSLVQKKPKKNATIPTLDEDYYSEEETDHQEVEETEPEKVDETGPEDMGVQDATPETEDEGVDPEDVTQAERDVNEDDDDETQPPSQQEQFSTQSEPQRQTQTEQSDNTVKKTRGPTKMRKVAKHIEDKVDVEFNALGEHVGRGSVTLSSFLGPFLREHVPVLLDDWRHLDEKTKDALWEEIQVKLFKLFHI